MICVECQKEYREYQRFCIGCRKYLTIVNLPKSLFKQTSSKFKTVKDIRGKKFNTKEIKDFEFLGSLPKKFSAMVFGMPGKGKSSMCLKLADRISTYTSRTLYISGEESSDTLAFKTKFEIFNLTNENIYFLDAHSLKEVKEGFKESGCKNLFVDSISRLNISPKGADGLTKMVPGVCVFVYHSLKEGNSFKGESAYEHDCDISISVADGVATTRKNRFHPTKSKEIFDVQKEESECNKTAEIN